MLKFKQDEWKKIGFACSALGFVFIVLAITLILSPSLLALGFIWPTLIGFALMAAATYSFHQIGKIRV